MAATKDLMDFGAFELGYDLFADQVFNPNNDGKSLEKFAGKLGVIECADGLCGPMCVHYYDGIETHFGLTRDEAWDFVDGVLKAKADFGGSNE